nr:unnamed protein product [Digitaria exilis]
MRLVLYIFQGRRCWRSRSLSATSVTYCTIGPAKTTAPGAASCATTNLSGLNLGGEISPAVGSLKSLSSIFLTWALRDLKSNGLSGQIPDEIGDCSSLRTLILKNNQLIGAIPSTLSQLPNLKILNLSANFLSGPIPIELSRINNLDTFEQWSPQAGDPSYEHGPSCV